MDFLFIEGLTPCKLVSPCPKPELLGGGDCSSTAVLIPIYFSQELVEDLFAMSSAEAALPSLAKEFRVLDNAELSDTSLDVAAPMMMMYVMVHVMMHVTMNE
jgi:hypothetical protein